jgi:DNA-binding transcriptional regulator YiaG
LSAKAGHDDQIELLEIMPMKLTDRLLAFMARYNLRRKDLCAVLQTPRGTMTHWLRDEATPPACMLALMDILEQSAEARRIAGIRE